MALYCAYVFTTAKPSSRFRIVAYFVSSTLVRADGFCVNARDNTLPVTNHPPGGLIFFRYSEQCSFPITLFEEQNDGFHKHFTPHG